MSEQPIFVRGWLPAWGVEGLRLCFAALLYAAARIDVQGWENLPPSGGFIISSNHLSYVDAPLIFTLLKGRKLTVFAADTYRPHPFFRTVLQAIDTIWVRRGAIGPSAMKAAIRALRGGSVLGVAPEGTRSRVTHALQVGKTGAAFLALSAQVPVVPVAIAYPDKVLPAVLKLRRQSVKATIGKPMRFPPLAAGHHPDSQLLEAYTTEIMCHIAAMLPPEYRGVYADHPRLKELLNEVIEA